MSLTPDENKLMTELLRKVKPLLKTFRPAFYLSSTKA